MEETILTKTQIEEIVERLGKKLTEDLKDEEKPPVFLCVMKGAMPFYSDLIKHVDLDMVCDYIQLSSYEGGLASTGQVKMLTDVSVDLAGRTVVIVEDIVDSGLSMSFLTKYLQDKYQPKRILICALFDKFCARKNPVKVDYAGYRLNESKFLVGYGLDYKQLLRNVPYVYVPSPSELEGWDKKSD